MLGQIEYMVISFDDADKNAKLSLRQTEILAKLNSIVEDLCDGCPKTYVVRHIRTASLNSFQPSSKISSRIWTLHA
jgi:hypothetical protein